MNSAQHSQTASWQNFFTDFKLYAFKAESAHAPALDARNAEQFFNLFKQYYVPFVKSGGTINVWEVAGVGTDEVRNCAVLGWLLDCQGSHGQGTLFLHWLLEALSVAPFSRACRAHLPQVLHAHPPYRATVENTYEQEGSDGVMPNSRVDIVIENESFLLFIEAKVHAGETGNQLERYSSILRSRAGKRPYAMIFLTPTGRPAKDESAGDIVCLSWKQLADSFEARIAADIPKDSPHPLLWVSLVQQFCQHIRTF
jgi:hypothetical protein